MIASHIIAPAAIESSLPVIDGQWHGFLGGFASSAPAEENWPFSGEKPEKVRQFLKILDEADRSQPSFYFLHVESPHYPFIYADDGRTYGAQITHLHGGARTLKQGRLADDRETSLVGYQAHLLQTRFVDLLLGMILDKLEERSLFDDSIVVVTADHGAGFLWDEGVSADGLTSIRASEILYIPLFIKSPRQNTGEESDRVVEIIDVVPTPTDILDLEIPWKIDGLSALSEERPNRRRVAHNY